LKTEATLSSARAGTPAEPRRWLMLTIVLSAALIALLDTFIVNVALPSIERELHASFAQVQLVVTGYSLTYAMMLVPGGRLGDLYGRKRLFLLGVGGFTLFSALCGIASYAILLVLFRLLQGAAVGLMFPQVLSFIHVTFPSQERPRAFGYYTAVTGLASILGQVIGGALLTANILGLGWRSIFLVNVPIGLVAWVAAALLLQESRKPDARNLDLGGTALLSLTLALLVFPLVEGGSLGWPMWALVCLVLAIPSFIAFLLYEQHMSRKDQTPLVPLAFFRQPRFRAGVLTVALAFFLFASNLFLHAFYLQTILGFTPLQAGVIVMVLSLAYILVSACYGYLPAGLAQRSLALAPLLILSGYLSICLSAQFLVPHWGIPPLLVALVILGLGMGTLMAPLLNKTLAGIAPQHAGVASGVFMTIFQTAGALGVAVIGGLDAELLQNGIAPLESFVFSVLVITVCSGCLSFTVRPLNASLKEK
jgi:EmrB/QacA subfamily drug resistance transporter